jgi:uncharacterized membrane protein YjjB (DUF3815 family)
LKKKSNLFNRKDIIAYFLIAGTGALIQLLSGALLNNTTRLSALIASSA